MTNTRSYQSRRPRWNCDFLEAWHRNLSEQPEEIPGQRVAPFSLPSPSPLPPPQSRLQALSPAPAGLGLYMPTMRAATGSQCTDLGRDQGAGPRLSRQRTPESWVCGLWSRSWSVGPPEARESTKTRPNPGSGGTLWSRAGDRDKGKSTWKFMLEKWLHLHRTGQEAGPGSSLTPLCNPVAKGPLSWGGIRNVLTSDTGLLCLGCILLHCTVQRFCFLFFVFLTDWSLVVPLHLASQRSNSIYLLTLCLCVLFRQVS